MWRLREDDFEKGNKIGKTRFEENQKHQYHLAIGWGI
jgi:hypothetical protein